MRRIDALEGQTNTNAQTTRRSGQSRLACYMNTIRATFVTLSMLGNAACVADTKDLQNMPSVSADAGATDGGNENNCDLATFAVLKNMLEEVRFPTETPGTLPDGTERRVLNRAEVAKIIADSIGRNVDWTADNFPAFSDVESDTWYAPAVEWLAELGVLVGNEDGSFVPYENATNCWIDELRERLKQLNTQLIAASIGIPRYELNAGEHDQPIFALHLHARFRPVEVSKVTVRFDLTTQPGARDHVDPREAITGVWLTWPDGTLVPGGDLVELTQDQNGWKADFEIDVDTEKWNTNNVVVRTDIRAGLSERHYLSTSIELREITAVDGDEQEVQIYTEPSSDTELFGAEIVLNPA